MALGWRRVCRTERGGLLRGSRRAGLWEDFGRLGLVEGVSGAGNGRSAEASILEMIEGTPAVEAHLGTAEKSPSCVLRPANVVWAAAANWLTHYE